MLFKNSLGLESLQDPELSLLVGYL